MHGVYSLYEVCFHLCHFPLSQRENKVIVALHSLGCFPHGALAEILSPRCGVCGEDGLSKCVIRIFSWRPYLHTWYKYEINNRGDSNGKNDQDDDDSVNNQDSRDGRMMVEYKAEPQMDRQHWQIHTYQYKLAYTAIYISTCIALICINVSWLNLNWYDTYIDRCVRTHIDG